MESLLILTHPDCAAHFPLPGHPERPERLAAALAGLEPLAHLVWQTAQPAGDDQLAAVHSPDYLAEIEAVGRTIAADGRTVALDADTCAGPGSLRAARLAAGAACQAVDAVIAGRPRKAMAITRPPGHHAEADRAMGFCIFNSIAAATARALAQPGIRRVAVCDFDVHHGNGTEAIFAGRGEVLFVSSHQVPLYPGTGGTDQPVAANIVNAALPPGSGSREFRHAWNHALLPRIDRFAPDLILVSAGFDAHWRDPLAQLELQTEDYSWIGHQLKRLADQHAAGRLVASLEGGYDLQALTECVRAFAEGLTLEH